MARNSEQDGVATDLARDAAARARTAAEWLADRDPGSLLDEVRSFARRKPGTYLALALGAGVLAGRLTRGLTAPTDNATPSAGPSGAPRTTPAYPVGAGQPAPSRTDRPGTVPVFDPIPNTPPPAPLGSPGAIGAVGGPRGDGAL
jgi:hypothetical protein